MKKGNKKYSNFAREEVLQNDCTYIDITKIAPQQKKIK